MSSARKDIPSELTGRSLLVFTLENPIRKVSTSIITHPHFDNMSLVLIAVSTVALAIDNPLNPPDSAFVYILSWLDSTLTGLFMFEVAVKIIALGFFMAENAYLRNGWNLMDFVITTLAAFSLSEGSTRFKFVKTLRTFRALRPLRMINRNPGLKLVVSSLIASIPQILNVIVVCLLVFTIFSILAVNNLKGKLYSCQGDVFDALSEAQLGLVAYPRLWSNLTDGEQTWFNASSAIAYKDFSSTIDQVTSRMVCELLGATWAATIPQNFNNVLQGCQAFFEMTTTEGWVTIMLAGVDATEIDMQPIPNYREGWTLFFIAFILVGTFFVMQLFVGVVIENFNKMKEKLDGTYLLSNTQREWLIINDSMLNLRPMRKMKAPQNKTRRVLFYLARSHNLEIVAMGCIMLNTMMMALNYFGEDDMYKAAIEYSNYVFAFIFTLEAVVKIAGLGRYYWKDSWNIFDFLIVSGSLLGMLYTWIGGSSVGTVAGAVRSFRTWRLFRLVQSAPSLRQLFNTLLITLPSLVSIGGLLFLIFFIYAAMGVQLFAKVKFGDLVTPTANFQTIARAMVTLVRCATGERWNDLMYELSSQDDCVEDPPYNPEMCGFNNTAGCKMLNGCGSPVAYAYFYSFTLLVTFILLNIFIAVILEGFANEKDRTDGLLLPHH
uniref:Ion transport domain-containing protein n=1 Tax=Globisporangium ultimum (strain ATCC 200006 / CBS 805.95 / DAOM BR144) TaxID=431595 RepID=K3WQ22_GLOUD